MSLRTLFLSRLIGLYCILVALSMMTRGQVTVETVTALLQNPSIMLILGVITLPLGWRWFSRIISGREVCSSSWSPFSVGWRSSRAYSFCSCPPEMEAGVFLEQLHYRQFFYRTGLFARPRYLPDLWRIQSQIALAGKTAGILTCFQA